MRLAAVAFAASMMAMTGVAVSAESPVASLTDIQGKVLVSQGEGFTSAAGLISLNVGDKIMVGPESSAAVYFEAAACSVVAKPASIFVVPAEAPCTAQTGMATDSLFVTPVADAPAYDSAAAPVLPILLGGAAVAGTVAIVVVATKKKNKSSGP
jgi:hypothetical protein